MLEKDPSRRATAAQVLESEWLPLSEKQGEEEEAGNEKARLLSCCDCRRRKLFFVVVVRGSDNSRLRARIRAFTAESKLHAAAASP